MRGHRIAAWPVALAIGLALTSCATLPTSGSVPLKTLQGTGGQAQQGVQVVPVPPGPGWSPTDIVNGFLAASASFDRHRHAVAREYLTPKLNRRWQPGWAATIINSPQISLANNRAVQQTRARPSALVNLTGQHFAKLQTAGQDQAGSVVVSPGPTQYQFSLVHMRGGWRIDAIYHANMPVSPTLLLLTSTDFARDYLPRNLYFYRAGVASNMLVPDPVYIPQTGPMSEVQGLVNALIHPPASSWLSYAVTTAFPPGTKLVRPPQVIAGITADVHVGGAAARAPLAQQRRMAAQLYWSLTRTPYATQYASPIRSVILHVGHRVFQPTQGTTATVPTAAPAPMYYLASGTPQPAISVLPVRPIRAATVPLPAAVGTRPFTAMATSPGRGSLLVAACAQRNLYLIKLPAGVQEGKNVRAATEITAVTKRLPTSCTSLSWDYNGNLWITTKSDTLTLATSRVRTLSKAGLIRVNHPWLSSVITALRVAPDGVRAAMIVGSGSSKRILVGAISRTAQFTFIGRTQQTLRVGSDIANPVALSWLDPDHLLVLGKARSGRTQLYSVPLNGGESTEIPVPRGVISVTADAQAVPRVAIGLAPTAGSPGTIDVAKGGWPSPNWVPVARGTSPVYPG